MKNFIAIITFILISVQSNSQNPVKLYYENENIVLYECSTILEMNKYIRDEFKINNLKDKNLDVKIDNGIYEGNQLDGIFYNLKVEPPYYLTVAPESPNGVTFQNTQQDIKYAIAIGGSYATDTTSGDVSERIILDGFKFIGYHEKQVWIYRANNCIVRNCIFSDMSNENAEAGVEIGTEANYNTIESNSFYRLTGSNGVHAVYLTNADHNMVKNNYVEYCQGAPFKAKWYSDYNIFDGNIIDGTGSYAYFTGRENTNSNGENDMPNYRRCKGNKIVNTTVRGHGNSKVYDNSYYCRMFVYYEGDPAHNFPECQWNEDSILDRYNERFDPSLPFYMPEQDHNNSFLTILDSFDVNIDKVIGSNNAFIYLCENPVGDSDNPLFGGKFEFKDDIAEAIPHEEIQTNYIKYLQKIEIIDESNKPRIFHPDFNLRTIEGDIIKKGDLVGTNGKLELEKWIVDTEINTNSKTYNITGAGQNISFELTNLSADYDIYLYNNSGVELARSWNGAVNEEEIIYLLKNNEEYLLKVILYSGSGQYSFTAKPVASQFYKSASLSSTYNKKLKLNKIESNIELSPNPFYENLNISIEVEKGANINIFLFNSNGTEVYSDMRITHQDGNLVYSLDGKDNNNNELKNGIYICVVEVDNKKYSYKILKDKR